MIGIIHFENSLNVCRIVWYQRWVKKCKVHKCKWINLWNISLLFLFKIGNIAEYVQSEFKLIQLAQKVLQFNVYFIFQWKYYYRYFEYMYWHFNENNINFYLDGISFRIWYFNTVSDNNEYSSVRRIYEIHVLKLL